MVKDKILSREELSSICKNLHQEKKTIGFTSGAFDIIHAGHADYLEKAKSQCDILVVGINSDKSVQRYKGPSRPIIPLEQRIIMVAALESVDYVFSFELESWHSSLYFTYYLKS